MKNNLLWFNKLALTACISLALAGCDRAVDETPSSETIESGVQSNNAVHKAPEMTSDQRVALAAQYANSPFELVDASELQVEGASSMVLTFSSPLDPDQDFSASVKLVDAEKGIVDGAWEISKNLLELKLRYLEPNRKLILTVLPELKNLNGQRLITQNLQVCDSDDSKYASPEACVTDLKSKPYQLRLTTQDIRPMVSFTSRGSLLPSAMIEGLPIQTQNVDQIDVNFFRVKESAISSFLSAWNNSSALPYWRSNDILKYADLAYSGRFELNPRKNQLETQLLPLKSIPELQKKGVYFAVMNQSGAYDYTNPATYFTISNIGVSVHRYQNQIGVFTQSIATGETLGDVNVTLLDKNGNVIDQKKTAKHDVLMFSPSAEPTLIMADHNGETTLVVVNRSSLDLTEFNIAGETYYDKQLFTFGPRDLYRPGETVLVNALLRDSDGYPLPEQPVRVDVLKPDNQVLRSFVWQPTSAGFYQTQVKLPDDAPTGKWSLRLNAGDDQARFYRFSVEDFLPERMAMEIKTDEPSTSLSDGDLQFNVKGWYLYGAPASNNELQGQLFLRPSRDLEALKGFEVGDVKETNLSRRLGEVETKLSNQGYANVTVSGEEWSSVKSPINVIFQASLLDSGGRPINRLTTQTLWPTSELPAIRPLFAKKSVYDYRSSRYVERATVDEGTNAEFEITYVNFEGQKVAAEALQVKLVRERRDYYWSWSDNGWTSDYNQKDIVIARTSVSLDNGGVTKVSFPVEWGAYRLEVAVPGSKYLSSTRFWAGYDWQDNTDGSGSVRPDQVKLKLDKPTYNWGDVVNVNVEAPVAGSGYLIVESNNGPLWWKEISVPTGGAIFEVPIDAKWKRHDLYLNAIVLRPGDNDSQATLKRAVGLLHLPINEEKRHIQFALDMPDRVRPNTTLPIKIKADASFKNVTVLLSAVDTGVLSITDFATPDPFQAFFGRKRYAVDQLDVYGQLIEGAGKLAKLKFGGDGDDEGDISRGGKKPPSFVQIIAQQVTPVTLDKNGEGVISFAIPDFNGELRFMAQAWTENEYGKAEERVKIAAPLIAELSTPRFLASGDTTTLMFELRNLTGQPQKVTLNSKSSGLIQLRDPADKIIELAADERQFVPFAVTALAGLGEGEVAITVAGLNLPDEANASVSRHWKIGVRPAYPSHTTSYDMTLNQSDMWVLSQPALDNFVPETLDGQLMLTSRPPLNIAQYIKELYAYPYGCAEQTTSGLYPSLYTTSEQLKAMGIKTISDEKRREMITLGIERLSAMQRNNGGFGLWSNVGEEEFWLTAYITDFLVRANTQGYSVNAAVLNNAMTRLQRYIQDPSTITDYGYIQSRGHVQFATRAYAALVLARQNKVSLSALRQLYNLQNDALSGLPLVQLGRALQIAGDNERGTDLIQKGLAKPRDTKYYYLGDYGSKVRDEALMLALLQEENIMQPQWDDLLLTLSKDLYSKRYLSTQERNAVFMAGRLVNNRPEALWKISLNDKTLSSEKAMSMRLDSQTIQAGVAINNPQNTKVYGRLDIVGYPKKAPEPVQNTLAITREFFDMNGNVLSLDNLKSGDLVFVSLNIKSSEHVPDALVVDLLPAGLELENQNLSKTSVDLKESGQALTSLLDAMKKTQIKYQEFRDDRYVAAITVEKTYSRGRGTQLVYLARAVTPGEYAVPPSYVESMYRPEWFSIGKAPERLIIKNK